MLQVDHLSFSYDKRVVLEDINLKIAKGDHISIIGESGCGKSTLLKIIYGLIDIQQGEVYWDGKPVLGPLYNLVPGENYMKYLAQNYDLMPFTTVSENINHFLSIFEPEYAAKRTAELLQLIELQDFADTKVKLLSGGQQQRVALARVLAQEPLVLLLDEPFSHIDNFRKNKLRRNLFGYLKKKNITVLTATHDPNDMLAFADRVIVLKDNRVIAKDTPQNLYDHPKDLYIASLFGEANKIPVNIVKTYANTKRRIIVYPHEFKVSLESGLEVVVTESYYKGSHYLIEGIYEDEKIHFYHNSPIDADEVVFLNISLDTINTRLNL